MTSDTKSENEDQIFPGAFVTIKNSCQLENYRGKTGRVLKIEDEIYTIKLTDTNIECTKLEIKKKC